uniref:Uncharacterized protein n=1 Tax=Rhizophora mucronata TaxID=61149 RepID=A0A2P2ND89_RHIMU
MTAFRLIIYIYIHTHFWYIEKLTGYDTRRKREIFVMISRTRS